MTIINYGAMFGPILRDMRMNAGMTQQQLGEASGVPSSMISTYERSRNIPELDTVIRLAVALGQRVTVLPTSVAKTMPERETVVDMARSWSRGEDGSGDGRGYDALRRSVSLLAEAEGKLPVIDESPHELIRQLNEKDAENAREIRRLRDVIATLHAVTLKEMDNEGR